MIPLIKSTFYKEKETKIKLANFIKNTDHLSFGIECEKFEKAFARYQGRKHAIMVNSGSSANLAIIQALLNLGMIKKNDLVGFSTLTWSTNTMSIMELGLQAVPIDVELDTLNVSSEMLLKSLKKYPIRMLFLTNLLGFCDDIDVIKNICKQNNIILIEDNCESLGSIYKGKKLGNFGFASTFSFYVGHHLSTIEGGMVTTDNEGLATMLRIVRAHGWDRNLSLKHRSNIRNRYHVNSTFYSRYTFYDLGFNFRPTDVAGFLGNVQLAYVDEITKKRNQNFLRFANILNNQTQNYYSIKFDHMDFVSNFAYPLICRSFAIRDRLAKKCNRLTEIRPIVGGDITKQPFFLKHARTYAGILEHSNAQLIHQQGLYFPNNPELSEKDIQIMIQIFSS